MPAYYFKDIRFAQFIGLNNSNQDLGHKLDENLSYIQTSPRSKMKYFPIFLASITILALFVILGKANFVHAPLSDDLSMLAFSNAFSIEWFSKGLADYFIVYPEYYGPQSNFVRPVSNLSYWIFGMIFRTDYPFLANKMQLVILTFGMIACFSILVGKLVLKVQPSAFVALLSVLASLLIPTFWTTPSPTYTSFVFDGLAITFCLLALYSVERDRLFAMTIWLTLALMTKEIAFPVILGFVLAFLIIRNRRGLSGCGIAISAFIALRLNSFGLHAQGVYVFDNDSTVLSELILEIARNIFTLPFGPVVYSEIFNSSGVNLLNRSGALLLINISIYALIALLAFRLRKQIHLRKLLERALASKSLDKHSLILLISGLAAIISFLFVAYVGANYRYAFNFIPFLFISLAGAQLSALTKRMLFSVFLIASLVASGPSVARFVKGSELESFRYRVVRDFFEAIRTHKTSKAIIVINDFVLAYANPRAVEILAPTQSKIIRGTSLYLDNCSVNNFAKIKTTVERGDSETRILVTLPECGRFAFESSPKLPGFVSGNLIRRNESIHYEFSPLANSHHQSISNWDGRNLTITTRGADILYFDFVDQSWKFIDSASP